MEVIVTDHAAERWSTRVEPGSTHRQSIGRIEELWPAASPLKSRTRAGQEVWKLESPVAGFVVKREAGKIVIVTVIGERELAMPFPTPDEDEEESFLPMQRTSRISFSVEWTHESGDLATTEAELRRFLVKRMAQGLVGKTTGRATVEKVEAEE